MFSSSISDSSSATKRYVVPSDSSTFVFADLSGVLQSAADVLPSAPTRSANMNLRSEIPESSQFVHVSLSCAKYVPVALRCFHLSSAASSAAGFLPAVVGSLAPEHTTKGSPAPFSPPTEQQRRKP